MVWMLSPPMSSRAAVLAARREALNKRIPIAIPHAYPLTPTDDPFGFECYGTYFGAHEADEIEAILPEGTSNANIRTVKAKAAKSAAFGADTTAKRSSSFEQSGPSVGRIRKVKNTSQDEKRLPKRKAKWDEKQDRMLRRCIRKWGWGCWKRIERSGRLPSSYTSQMISNRARTLNLQSAESTGKSEQARAKLNVHDAVKEKASDDSAKRSKSVEQTGGRSEEG